MKRIWKVWLRLLALSTFVVLPYYVMKKNWLDANEPQYKLVSVHDADTWFIGMSTMRADLSPEHFIRAFGGDREGFNLAINRGKTPHGPLLTDFLKKKFNPEGCERSLFIVEWHPGSFTVKVQKLRHRFREEDEIIYKMNLVNSDPNFEFILRRMHHDYSLGLNLLLSNNGQERFILHETGWAAHRVPDVFPTQEEIELESRNVENQENKFYALRMASFFELIDHLATCGEVIVLATPVGDALRGTPVADEFIYAENLLRARKDVLFLDYSDWAKRTDFADFRHLHQEAAIRLSSDVGKKARELLGETL